MTLDDASTLKLGEKVEFEREEYEVAGLLRFSVIGHSELAIWNSYQGYVLTSPRHISRIAA